MDFLYTEVCVPLAQFLSGCEPKHTEFIVRFIRAALFYEELPPADADLPPHFRVFCEHWVYDTFDEWERSCIFGALAYHIWPPQPATHHVYIGDAKATFHPSDPCFRLYLQARPDAPFRVQLFNHRGTLLRPSYPCAMLVPGEHLFCLKFFD